MNDRLIGNFKNEEGITLKDTARHVGCSISYINKWENGVCT